MNQVPYSESRSFRRHRTECSGHGVARGILAPVTKCMVGYYTVRLEVGAVRRGLHLAG